MKLIPELHFEDWDYLDNDVFIKGKLKVEVRGDNSILFIKSTNGTFFEVKEINTYWEIKSYDIFLNSDIISDEENYDYQMEIYSYIKEEYSNAEYVIINKLTNQIYAICDLFDTEGDWNSNKLKNLWSNDEIIVLNMIDEVNPLQYIKGEWREIEMLDININSAARERMRILNKLIIE